MPKFTVTTDSTKDEETTKEALEFAHAKAATDDAQVALAEMARDALPDGKHAEFAVKVEDEGGKEIYRAGLSFNAQTEDEIEPEGDGADADGRLPTEQDP
jgi:hypothetical protein